MKHRVNDPHDHIYNPVIARYHIDTNSVNLAIANASDEIVDWNVKDFDPYNSVVIGAGWKFYAPLPGFYNVICQILFDASTGWATTEAVKFMLYKNGSYYSSLGYKSVLNSGGASVYVGTTGIDTIELSAGDYLEVYLWQSSGITQNIYTTVDGYNFVSIFRIN